MDARLSYLHRMSSQLHDWHASYEAIANRAKQGSFHSKLQASRYLDVLHERRYRVFLSLEELRYAQEDRWDEVRQRAEEAWKALKSATQEVGQRIAAGST